MTFKKFFVGVLLTFIMIGALGANALLFSARSFQHNLAELAPSTQGILDVQALYDVEAEVKRIEADSAEERGRVLKLENDANAAAQGALDDQAAASQLAIGLVKEIALLEQEAGIATPVALTSAEGAPAPSPVSSAALLARIQALAASSTLSDESRALAGVMLPKAEQMAALERSAAEKTAEAELLRSQARLESGGLAQADQQILGLKANFAADGIENYRVIRNEALAVMRSSPFKINQTLVQTHPHFLSIGLVLMMGLLGAVLYLFPAYMTREEDVTFAEIVVRVVFGMCAALAFYVVMNAAISGFSFAPGAGPQAQNALNPFSAALIGVVAGVLADDIAKFIQRRGSQLLGGAGGITAPAGGARRPLAPRQAAVTDDDDDAPLTGAMGPGASLEMRGGPPPA